MVDAAWASVMAEETFHVKQGSRRCYLQLLTDHRVGGKYLFYGENFRVYRRFGIGVQSRESQLLHQLSGVILYKSPFSLEFADNAVPL